VGWWGRRKLGVASLVGVAACAALLVGAFAPPASARSLLQLPPIQIPLLGRTQPPSSSTPPTPAPSSNSVDAADDSLMDPGRTNSDQDDDIAPPLARLWIHKWDQSPTYALIVGDKVFVGLAAGMSATGRQEPDRVVALRLSSGRELWSGTLSPDCADPYPAYDDGRVFVANSCGVVAAFDAVTGRFLWGAEPAPPCGSVGPNTPIATAGTLYVVGGCNGQLSALDEATGKVRWDVQSGGLACCSIAVDSGRVYLSGCYAAAAWQAATGAEIWKDASTGCGQIVSCGAGGNQVVAYGDRVAIGGELFDSASGVPAGSYRSSCSSPAVSSDRLFESTDTGIGAFDPESGARIWSTRADTGAGSPLAAGSDVFVLGGTAGATAKLLAFDGASGAQRETTIVQANEAGSPASAEGVMILSGGTSVSAYVSLFQPSSDEVAVRATPPVVVYGRHDGVTIDGRLGPTLRAAGSRPIALLRAAFPAHRLTSARRSASYADGGFLLSAKATVDTFYSVAPASGRGRLGIVFVAVYPNGRVGFRSDRATRRIDARLRLSFDPKVRLQGHAAYIYLDRVARHELVRLGGGRLVGGHGRARMSTSFAPVRDVGAGDEVLWCVPRMSRLGLGYDDLVDRRCGQAEIRYSG
jgi:outer membrane protein assembly factor BamB